MPIDRRRLLGLSAAAATTLTLGRGSALAIPTATDEVRDSALSWFPTHGFGSIPPLDLMTGDAFNGGLRYDETGSEDPEQPWMRLQPAARIEDIAERDRDGVLATFNIIGLSHSEPDEDAIMPAVLRFLIDERNLDPANMLFVSTEAFRPYLDRIDEVSADRFLERPLEVAQAMGDGSGYFAPRGHPNGPAFPSVGLYYPVPGATPKGDPVYPPPGYIELAEIGLAPNAGGGTLAGLGMERIAMAEGGDVPDFGETRLNLLRLLEDEAERTGRPLPEGYTQFASL